MKRSKRIRLHLRKRVLPFLAPPLTALAIRLLAATLRIRIHDPEHLTEGVSGKPILFVFWHNRILLMPYFYRRLFSKRPMVVMISESRDGALIAKTASYFGIEAARGSTSGRGVTALIRMTRELIRCGKNVGITPDGPRGPRYRVQRGIVHLATVSRRPVVPVTIRLSRKWVMSSWDGFQIPKPFSQCDFYLLKAIPHDHPDLIKEVERQLAQHDERTGITI